MTEPTEIDALIAEARKLPAEFRAAQLPESAYLEDDALAELDAVAYLAVDATKKLAAALESVYADSLTAQAEHARWQERAEQAEAELLGLRDLSTAH